MEKAQEKDTIYWLEKNGARENHVVITSWDEAGGGETSHIDFQTFWMQIIPAHFHCSSSHVNTSSQHRS